MEQKNGAATASTILGIVSLVLAIIGGITFGVIGAAIALILGIVAVVLGINAKKQTGGTKGQAGFVCGLIGIIFAVIFAVGCSICGAVESSSTKTSYTCSDCRQSGARTTVLAPLCLQSEGCCLGSSLFSKEEKMFPSIHLGFADIPTYSTIFLAGFFIAIVIARKIAGRYRLAKEDVLYGAIYAAIGILIGSKLLYCLTRLPSLIQKWDAVAAGFDKNFMQTLLFLMNYLFGGLVFYGGLIGAFLGIFCYCKQYHLSYVSYMDVFAPLIPFVHGIGRIGCFCSGCCYGIEYHGPFAIQFPYNEAVPQLSQVPRFPVQLLEALMNFLLCGILFCLMKKKNLRNGRLMGIYLIYYSIARFLLEMLRGDKIRGSISIFSTSQLISLILLPVGIVLVRGKWVEKHCKEEKSGV